MSGYDGATPEDTRMLHPRYYVNNTTEVESEGEVDGDGERESEVRSGHL